MKTVLSAGLWLSGTIYFVSAGSLVILLSLVIPPRRFSTLTRWICRGALWSVGQKLRIVGPIPNPKNGPYLYLFNHTSLLDTFIVMAVLPEFTASVGKMEQFKVPIWGLILKRYGTIPLNRSDQDKAIIQLNAVEREVLTGTSLLVSPEGTRSLNGQLQPFKKGPFHIAKNTGVVIIPIAIKGAFEAKRKGSWIITPNPITVRFGSPIVPKSPENNAVETIRDNCREAFKQLSALNGGT